MGPGGRIVAKKERDARKNKNAMRGEYTPERRTRCSAFIGVAYGVNPPRLSALVILLLFRACAFFPRKHCFGAFTGGIPLPILDTTPSGVLYSVV